MSIVYPEDRQSVINRISSDVQNELPELNPFLRESLIKANIVAFGGRFFDIYTQISQLQNELFVQTATDIFFIRQLGLLKGIDVNPASSATGFITATGTAGSIIDEGTLYETQNEIEYEAINQNYLISSQIISVQSLTRSGSVATATFATAHNLAPNISIVIAGADQAEYNGTFTIIDVPTEDSLTYAVSGSPATPATGTITLTASYASVEVRSSETGQDKNLDSGAKLTLKSSIVGVDDDAYVQFDKISGGADEEDTESYRERVIDIYANPISNFNDANIINVVKSIPGNTKVWVFDATPVAGECEIYFIRANDPDIIPDPTELAEAKTEVLKIKTAPMLDSDVHVLAPTKVPVDFVFTELTPDSQSLRETIEERLEQFFKEVPNVSEDLSEDAYRSTIWQSKNELTGEFVQSFTLTSPTGDITINDGELATFGSVTWNI
jgi:uncharacterized phage protein gp47/JayE